MGLFGNIMKIVMIIFVSLFGVFMLMFGAMFIFPNFSVLGYHVLNSNGFQSSVEYFFDDSQSVDSEKNKFWNEADSVQIQTDGYDVTIRTIKSNEIYGKQSVACVVNGGYSGFVKGETYNITYSSTLTTKKYLSGVQEGKKVFFVRIKEPERGFIIRNSTKLTFIVPEGVLEEKPVEIITKSGTIYLGGDKENSSKKIVTNEMELKSDSGQIVFNNFECTENLSITKNNGNVEFSEDQKLDCNTTIKITSSGLSYVNIPNFGVEGSPTKRLIVETRNSHTILGNVCGILKVISKKGVCEVEKVTKSADFEIFETDTKVKTLEGTLQLVSTSGRFTCQSVAGDVLNADMKSGSCTFSKTKGKVNWTSTSGSITLLAPEQDLDLKTEKGKIKVDCNNVSFDINIESKSGEVVFSKAKGSVCVNKNKSGETNPNIKGSFSKDLDGKESVFKTTGGNLTLSVPQTTSVLLQWSTSNSASITFDGWSSTNKNTKAYSGSDKDWVTNWTGTATDEDLNIPRIISKNTNGKIVIKKL